MNLFEIAADFRQIADLVDDPEIDLDEQALLDSWEGTDGAFNDKAFAWLQVIKNKEAGIDARKKLIADLTEKNRHDDNAITRMKSTLLQVMDYAGKKTAGTEILSATVCAKGGPKPMVWADGVKEDPRLLPEEYQKTETIYRADMDKIKAALDAGEVVPGVEYGERGSYLRIK